LVEDLLSHASPDELVLDPFSGTGTTPVAAAALGIKAHSVDINPFLVWLGNLKCSAFSEADATAFNEVAARIIKSFRRRSLRRLLWVPDLHQIEKWWDEPVLRSLSVLFAQIDTVKADDAIRDLLRIAFCRTAIETSHASFNHQSMSFKKRGASAQVGLFPGTADEAQEGVLQKFRQAVAQVSLGTADDNPTTEGKVFLGDSRNLAKALPSKSYTKVVTSPPYPNRMSYIRELRPYMYWLGYLTNGRAAGELDWQAIGGTWGCATSNLGSWEASPDITVPFPKFARIVDAISADHKLLGPYVHKYFEDIQVHIRSLKTVLAPAARCHYVVGNSKFYDTMLPVEEIYAALFEDSDFEAVSIERIRKRNSKKELYEFIVHASNPQSS